MKFIFRAAVLGLFLAPASAALGDGNAVIEINDSRKDTESRIADIFKERLKVVSSLNVKRGDAEDLVLQIDLAADKERGVPKIIYIIDTRIMRRDKNGKATAQIIGIDSTGAFKAAAGKADGLLKWANKWNSATLPIRFYVGGDRIVVGQTLLVTAQAPLSENQLIASFRTIVQLWPEIMKDLRANDFVE